MEMQVCLTQAGIGDCILIRCREHGALANILIDSGQNMNVFEAVLRRILDQGERIDLLVFTHDDNDHIKGACRLLERLYETCCEPEWDARAKKSLFHGIGAERILFNFGGNGTRELLAAKDVKKLSEVLKGGFDFRKLDFVLSDAQPDEEHPYPNMLRLRWGMGKNGTGSEIIRSLTQEDLEAEGSQVELLILTPDKKTLAAYIENAWKELNAGSHPLSSPPQKKKTAEWDKSIQYRFIHPGKLGDDKKPANNASISFLLLFGEHIALFAGDASPDDMVASGREYLKRSKSGEDHIKLAFLKLPHHGSSHNVTREFLTFYRTKHYLVSTSGHAGYGHPGKGTLALIAGVLKPGETAHIYSSYGWWRNEINPGFCRAEQREGNWSPKGDICTLIDEEGGKRYLKFHKLSLSSLPIGKDIQLSR